MHIQIVVKATFFFIYFPNICYYNYVLFYFRILNKLLIKWWRKNLKQENQVKSKNDKSILVNTLQYDLGYLLD